MEQFNQNYFELFGLPERYEVNLDLLAEKYRALQNKWHPDRFSQADEQQKLEAVQTSSLLNQAFNTLTTPLSRAGYMLTLRGCDIDTVSQQDIGMDLLMEQMQLRESLEELPDDDSALNELDVLKQQVNDKLQKCQSAFNEKIALNAVDDAKKLYHELQFLVKLNKEIEISEEQRLDY